MPYQWHSRRIFHAFAKAAKESARQRRESG